MQKQKYENLKLKQPQLVDQIIAEFGMDKIISTKSFPEESTKV